MKYTKVIILIIVFIIVLTAAGILYSQLSGNQDRQTETTVSSDTTAGASTAPSASVSGSASESSTPGSGSSESSIPSSASSTAAEGLDIGNLARDFSAVTSDGKEVTLSGLRGKVVVLNFWASWCGPCQSEMPDFQKLQDDLDDQGDAAEAVILTVNLTDGAWETKDTAKAFLDKMGYTFPVIFDSGEVTELYEIYSIPNTYILNKDGIIVQKFLGATNKEALEDAISEAMS